jgi:hypothetical protein
MTFVEDLINYNSPLKFDACGFLGVPRLYGAPIKLGFDLKFIFGNVKIWRIGNLCF